MNWARKELEWEVPNPFQARRLKEPAGRNRWLSQAEASSLIQAAERARRSPHLADFIRLGLNTGMRPGELLKLTWARVDLEMGLIYLDADDQKRLIRRLIKNLDLDESTWVPREIQWFINGQKDEGRRAGDVPAGDDLFQITHKRIYEGYEEICEQGGVDRYHFGIVRDQFQRIYDFIDGGQYHA